MPNSEDIYDQILAKERDLVSWFVSLPEYEKAKVKSHYLLHPNATEEIIAINFSLKQTKKKLKNQQGVVEKLESDQSELTTFCSDLIAKYDKLNYSHKVLRTENDNLRSDLHKNLDALDKSKFTINKILVKHAVTMFELDRTFQKKYGDINQYNRNSRFATPTYRRRSRVHASSGTITSAFIQQLKDEKILTEEAVRTKDSDEVPKKRSRRTFSTGATRSWARK